MCLQRFYVYNMSPLFNTDLYINIYDNNYKILYNKYKNKIINIKYIIINIKNK